MDKIGLHTKISTLIRQHPDALETIIRISPRFEKLRNPILRKVMASRTSIGMASRVAGVAPHKFFDALLPLGFHMIDGSVDTQEDSVLHRPEILQDISTATVHTLDVRPVIAAGKDPLQQILKAAQSLAVSEILLIINTFEPTPLIQVLRRKGFDCAVEVMGDDLVHTYFKKTSAGELIIADDHAAPSDWDDIILRFAGKFQKIDVRQLEMPLPMHTILSALESLPADAALYVHHKRIPVFLLPELHDQGWQYRAKEMGPDHVDMLIFRAN